MDANSLFPSKYLKASDAIPAITLTIAKVTKEIMKNQDGNDEEKPCVYFVEVEKPMVLNRTNCNTVIALHGADTDGWVGKKIILGTETITAFGQTKPALRFKSEPVTYDHKTLLKMYGDLMKEATKLGLDMGSDFNVTEKTPDDAIIQAGKQLREVINAAKAI